MTDKKHWIVSPAGVYALVDAGEPLAVWTKARGWAEASEPDRTGRVHVVHADAGHAGPLAYGALGEGFAALGWSPGPPPEPVDITKDPVLVDQQPAAGPAEPKTKPAAGGKNEEK
jgi:hypothetical protein